MVNRDRLILESLTTLVESFRVAIRRWGDTPDVKNAIDLFKKNIQSRQDLAPEQRDIGRWADKPFEEFKAFVDNPPSSKRQEKEQVKEEGAEKVYEDDDWIILNITTKEASVAYGKGTKWCISAERDNAWYQYYPISSPIQFIISKKNPDKYCFIKRHGVYNQFFNEHDEMVYLDSILPTRIEKVLMTTPGLNGIYIKDGVTHIFVNGQLHNENGPARWGTNGRKEWFMWGRFHNEKGPAIINPNGEKFWWLDGLLYTQREWKEELKRRGLPVPND